MILSSYRGFDVFGDCRRGSPCEKELAHYGVDAAAIDAGAAAAGGVAASDGNFHRLAWGVGTGLAVWLLTRFLDTHLFKKGGSR